MSEAGAGGGRRGPVGDGAFAREPSPTVGAAGALIKANKDFDLLIVPNVGHGTAIAPGYGLRRAWDYLVRNLMGATPPVEYNLSPPAAKK